MPENQKKLDATEELVSLAEEAGMPLIEMALGFVTSHPSVTSAIIGPRTMEQLESQLAAPPVLDGDVLDRIDAIATPGGNFSAADAGFVLPSIGNASFRRRAPASQAAFVMAAPSN